MGSGVHSQEIVERPSVAKLAGRWKVGMLEYWNDGGRAPQVTHYSIIP